MGKATVRVVVDDSKLVKMIHEIEAQGKPVRIVADGVNYGIFAEFGTVRMGARPFLTPAVEANRDTLERALKQAGEDFGQASLVVDKVAFDVMRDAQRLAPVDTGALRASLHVVDKESGEFDYGVPGQ